jgi:DNA-binding NarL/FixJ family response regulator
LSVIRVSIIEDDDQAREALAVLFNGTPGFRCASSYALAEDALKELPTVECDLVLLDLSLPPHQTGGEGIDCARKLKQLRPGLLILVLTVYEDTDKIYECLKAGACGYLLKKTPLPRLVESVQEAVAGGSPMSPAIARKVTDYFKALPPASAGIHSLSDREREVLDHISRGRVKKEIADRLKLSPHTVDNYIRRIYEKLQVSSRAEATAKYLGR